MLREPGYCGLKTGITEAAGPCCSVAYQKDGYNLIIILLSCESMERRWEEVPMLVEWATNLESESAMSLRPVEPKNSFKKENLMISGVSTSFDSRGNSLV